ncbi:MAG: tRNA 2-thiouridine(34) synthase MnmA, partial [Anaerolineae bacterium]|nr:tRNA 2-thiouridine(34) synthase MnmA [Anaerolineae bacterium]
AALLVERGFAVSGVTLRLWREGADSQSSMDADIASAQAVCAQLGIEHRVLDVSREFYHAVVEYFASEYIQGRTPNPCVRCNRWLKFGLLLERLSLWGADALATGHYARVARVDDGFRLLRGLDADKDQSYFLYMLGQQQLGSLLFPLGDWRKAHVRDYVKSQGLALAGRPESQDVCFMRDADYRDFVQRHWPEAVQPGPIYDAQGRYLGEHRGLPFYTIGQREGLGISAPRPLYVLEIDSARNALVVGHAEALGNSALLAEEVSYVGGSPLSPASTITAKIRYRAREVAARFWPLPGWRARLVFDQPLRDITPGQAVVFYRGQEVLGGGLISRALSDGPR